MIYFKFFFSFISSGSLSFGTPPRFLIEFGSNQLTKTSLLDISAIKNELGYLPKKTMNDSYCEIAKWVTEIGGWEKYLEQYKINVSHRK